MSIINSSALPPPPPYFSQAILSPAGGDTLYLSGQCGTLNGVFIEGTVADRTVQIFKNVTAVLAEAGMGLEDIVFVTIYLSKYAEDFGNMNEAYVKVFSSTGKALPARACVGVAALPKNTDIEIVVTARKASP
ncbi:hypothetical protein RQP46_007198 [Phenoliferia psychrophenolica]